ncbi:MAG: hypothetical protein EPN86_03440 [Nanoarchaeota archaeon]|nr:MAG: hypothetical protein EPN86_03440 [Nanoarchaeota archaeon]
MRRPIKYQIIKLSVTGAGSFPISAETDKAYKKVTGIQFNSTDSNALKDTVFSKFEIDSNEIFPDGFEVKLIQTGLEVTPNERFYKVDERAEGSTVAGSYKDAGNAAAYPYNAYIYLRLENRVDDEKASS